MKKQNRILKNISFLFIKIIVFFSIPCLLNADTINGINVPNEPDKKLNNESIKGIDSNDDGIRDDVERFLAKEFASNPLFYKEAKVYAVTLQAAIVNTTPKTIAAHLNSFRKINDSQKLEDFDKITPLTLNTNQRRGAYGDAFAGVMISDVDAVLTPLAEKSGKFVVVDGVMIALKND